MEEQRRRDLSSAAIVQQPFVAGRGEKFAFFVIFFLSASPPLTPISPSFRGFIRVLSAFRQRHPAAASSVTRLLELRIISIYYIYICSLDS